MSNVYDHAHGLAREIRDSDEFKNLKSLQDQVNQEDTSKKMFRNFRQTQMELQVKQMQGQEITQEEQEKIQHLFDTVNLNPTISKLLEAEQRLNVILEDVMKIVMEPTKEIYEDEDSEPQT